MAAITIKIHSKKMFNSPMAAKAPAANIRESPGRNGKKTNPVSQNIIKNKIT